MKLYKALYAIGFKKSYASKFLFIAFLGTHIPLLGVIFYILFTPDLMLSNKTMFFMVLGLTLIAAIITLIVLKNLLAPIHYATKMMNEFKKSKTVLQVEEKYNDEAGLLLQNIHETLNQINILTKEKNDFISLIAHDLRNPLITIMGFAEIIKDSTSLKEIMEFIDIIEKSSTQGLVIANETLSLMKAENYVVNDQNMEFINVKSFIEELLVLLEGFKLKKEIEIIFSISDQDKIKVEPIIYSHIIQNVLSNAIKYSLKMGKVFIEGKVDNNQYVLTIKDHGIGFDQTKADDLFKMKSVGVSSNQSAGIGLFITKKLIEKHHGSIEAQSKGLHYGATFTIKTPI